MTVHLYMNYTKEPLTRELKSLSEVLEIIEVLGERRLKMVVILDFPTWNSSEDMKSQIVIDP